MKDLFEFLRQLEENNNREWFRNNKGKYLSAKAVYEEFIGKIIEGISVFDQEVAGLMVKDTVFRIYRDVRFSADKSPYKTHMGAFIAKGGRMSARGGYYVHIQPGGCLFAGGIWCPDAALLKALRNDVYSNIQEFRSIIENQSFARYFKMDGDKLKKVPSPFPKDSPDAEWVKYKSYTTVNFVPDDFFFGNDAVKRCVDRLELLYPFNRFLNYTVDETMAK